jgi:hypothetical protein
LTLDYGVGGRITTKPTLVGHIHPNIIIFSQKLLGWCDDNSKTEPKHDFTILTL